MKAIVLCAGYGKRLGDLTKTCPKPMLEVGNQPLLGHTLRWLTSQGIHDIGINLHYRPDDIIHYIEDGSRWKANLYIAHEKKLLGTAGALTNFKSWLAGEPCLLIYGDILTTQQIAPLVNIHTQHNAFASLIVHQRQRSNSVVQFDSDGKIIGFWERPDNATREAAGLNTAPNWVNSAIQILSPEAVSWAIEHSAEDLPRDVYSPNISSKTMYALPLTGQRVAIDSPERLHLAQGLIQDDA